jgi:hypothetical protein
MVDHVLRGSSKNQFATAAGTVSPHQQAIGSARSRTVNERLPML